MKATFMIRTAIVRSQMKKQDSCIDQWMNDVKSWMNEECFLQYTELMKRLEKKNM